MRRSPPSSPRSAAAAAAAISVASLESGCRPMAVAACRRDAEDWHSLGSLLSTSLMREREMIPAKSRLPPLGSAVVSGKPLCHVFARSRLRRLADSIEFGSHVFRVRVVD